MLNISWSWMQVSKWTSLTTSFTVFLVFKWTTKSGMKSTFSGFYTVFDIVRISCHLAVKSRLIKPFRIIFSLRNSSASLPLLPSSSLVFIRHLDNINVLKMITPSTILLRWRSWRALNNISWPCNYWRAWENIYISWEAGKCFLVFSLISLHLVPVPLRFKYSVE